MADIIVIGLAVILLFFCYHPPTFELLHEHKSKKQQIKELDYPGMFLWTAGLVIFLMGISWVRNSRDFWWLATLTRTGWGYIPMEERSSHLRNRSWKRLSYRLRALGGLRKRQVPLDANALLLEPRLHISRSMRNRWE